LNALPRPASGRILREPGQASAYQNCGGGDARCGDENARLAEQERARLAAEGARRRDQEKAAADAKAAEEQRVAAEKTKQAVLEQVAEAERQRIATDTPATSKPPESKMAAADASADEPAAGPIAIERKQGPSLASLGDGSPPVELVKSVQTELRRVGCLTAAADGEWKTASQRSLTLFNKHAGTKLNVSSQVSMHSMPSSSGRREFAR